MMQGQSFAICLFARRPHSISVFATFQILFYFAFHLFYHVTLPQPYTQVLHGAQASFVSVTAILVQLDRSPFEPIIVENPVALSFSPPIQD
jgi:hypothetical protein